jgi:hypothetical protein
MFALKLKSFVNEVAGSGVAKAVRESSNVDSIKIEEKMSFFINNISIFL